MTEKDSLSRHEKDAAAVRVFPPGVPLPTVLGGVALQYQWPIEIQFKLPTPERYWIGGLIVAASLLGLGLWSVILFRKSGQHENPWKPTPQIVERGPFRITRNPMYLQMVLVCIGFAVILMNLWILVLTPACLWALQYLVIQQEACYLEKKFGETYLNYKRRFGAGFDKRMSPDASDESGFFLNRFCLLHETRSYVHP